MPPPAAPQPDLRPLVDLLPIAGGSGTLSNRYLDTDAGRAAAGFPAGQDRIADGNQFAGRHRHRRERAGADLRADLQRRRADRPHRDRQPGRHAAVVRMLRHEPVDDVQAHRRPCRRLGVRRDRRRQAGQPGAGGDRLHPPPGHRATDGGCAQLRTASARRHRPHRGRRDSRGPHRGPARVDPCGDKVDAGDDRRQRGTGQTGHHYRTDHRRADRRGAGVHLLGHPGPIRPVRPGWRRTAACLPERDRRRAPITGPARRFPAVGVPARGHPPGAVPGQSLAGRPHVAVAGGAHRRDRRRRREVVGRLAEFVRVSRNGANGRSRNRIRPA